MFYLSRAEQVALFVLLGLLLTGAGVLTYARGHHAARASPSQPIFVPAPAETPPGGEIVVHLSGAVVRPGVYRLASGSRVADALDRAGGATPEADLDAVNLAARLRDGDKIAIPTQSQHEPGRLLARKPAHLQRPLSLNTSTAEELESLPGIGPVYAQRIIAYRERKMREEGRGFQSVDELLNVPGIGPRRFTALRDLVAP